ncbi:unnamed protein product [Oppiella nova]|uniref:Uncharacterized protein n=1 Tax=Oppiella nova TaxID=334625 RepID=A0A7R9M896_9ACAR|nr:unnamed protein product [Oppiella nova]CAG2172647.1 unnamed protein product [Oppiella nova]
MFLNKMCLRVVHKVLTISIYLVYIIGNSCDTYADNNITNETSGQYFTAQELISRSEPKLVDIFVDGVTGGTNNSVIRFRDIFGIGLKDNFTINQRENFENKQANAQLPQHGTNISHSLNLCNKLGEQSEPKANCLLSPILTPTVNDQKVPLFPVYFHMDDKDIQGPYPLPLSNTSYIAMMVKVCSKPYGQLLIYDEESKQQLLSFSNEGHTDMCNYYDDQSNYETFVSDSNKFSLTPQLTEIKYNDPFQLKGFSLDIYYFVVQFRNISERELYGKYDEDHHQEVAYVPNTSITYKLIPTPPTGGVDISVPIRIYIEYLDIDVDSGDYVVIGPGSQSKHRELSKTQIITENIGEVDDYQEVVIYADSVYIRLVTHHSLKRGTTELKGTALKFRWYESNTTVTDRRDIPVLKRI